jgi:hypothetical protein
MNDAQSIKSIVPYIVVLLLALGVATTLWGVYGAVTHSPGNPQNFEQQSVKQTVPNK